MMIFPICTKCSSVAVVKDYGLHHYQQTLNLMRGRTLEYPLKPLLLVHFVELNPPQADSLNSS